MKITTLLFSVICVILSVAHISLYIENQNLRDELKLLQENYELLSNNNIRSSSITSPAKIKTVDVNEAAEVTSLQNTALTSKSRSATTDVLEQNFQRILEQKYAILFSALRLSGQDQKKLSELLMARERILGLSNLGYLASDTEVKASVENQQALLDQIDHQIALLLNPEDIKKYELLKDSSYEQYQINSFYASLPNQQGLNQEKKNTLLLSKLEEKQACARLLEVSADEINKASPSDKKMLVERFKESLRTYNDNYLRVAKENLNDEQYAALRDNEQKQFDDVWQGVIAGWQHE